MELTGYILRPELVDIKSQTRVLVAMGLKVRILVGRHRCFFTIEMKHCLLDKAIELRPTWAEAYLNRGFALANMKKFDDALADFERGIQLNPRIPNLYRARAYIYKVKGNAALAAADELRAAQIEQGRF